MQVWNRDNPESVKATKRAYYAKNKDRIKEKTAKYAKEDAVRTRGYKRKASAKWRAKNAEISKQRASEYRRLNLEKVRAARSRYHAEHRVEISQRMKLWKMSNPEKNSIYKAKRRERTRVGDLTPAERKRMSEIYRQCRRVTEDTGIPHQVDHRIPLSRGGRHHPDNLQILTAVINQRKHTKCSEIFA